jgi:8-oxo-dGTP diphosphatase
MTETNRPKVGVGVWVIDEKHRALMMHRQGSTGADTWSCPGGKLEVREEIADCAIREAKEETGIKITKVEFLGVTNDYSSDDNHYITIHVKAVGWSGEPKNMEPNKCLEIGWFYIHDLPLPLFLPQVHLLESEFFCLCGSGKSFRNCQLPSYVTRSYSPV